MSDALTDIGIDQQRNAVLIKIEKAELNFQENPDIEKAGELIRLWKEYVRMPSGYWSSSNESLAYERLALYEIYVKTGEVPVLPISVYENLQSTINKVIRVGSGFIVESMDKEILSKIYDKTKVNPNYRNFRIKLVLEEVEEISCLECPIMHRGCGGSCESKNLDELKGRRELVDKGRSISRR